MQRICLIFLTVFAGQLGAEQAFDVDDLHMKVIPRTAEEKARIDAATAPTSDFSKPERFEAKPAGAATVRLSNTTHAFSQPSGNMEFAKELDFKVGNGLFKKLWVSSPSSTLASDGLGPMFSARSCQRCHLKDGRGHPPENPDDGNVSMILALGVPDPSAAMAEIEGYLTTLPEPNYGRQLHPFSVVGVPAEGTFDVSYDEEVVTLSGGETASLRHPTYLPDQLTYGMLAPNVMISPRVAPQMIGLGLLDAVPAQDILGRADPHDLDGDGISGRAQIVMSAEFGVPMLGRFGLKAGQPSVREQSAAAFAGDIGISSTLFPNGAGDCTKAQELCQAAPNGNTGVHDNAEIGDEGLELVTFYASNLGVPARRHTDTPAVLRGKQVFYETGCVACHTPKFVTHRLHDQPEQSFQLIWPYTDMLLHDMGPALADNLPEGRANGREWRTPPLWGIGLTERVSGHTYFLHDGRARNLLEAVLWHGGEAETQRNAVIAMPPEDRAALITFLESL